MKKVLILCILAIGMIANAQTNNVITKKLQLQNVPIGDYSGQNLVIGRDKIVKRVTDNSVKTINGIPPIAGNVNIQSGGSLPYKSYVARLNVGADVNPGATVLYNNIGDIYWYRTDVGQYYAVSDNLFSFGRTQVIVQNDYLEYFVSASTNTNLNGFISLWSRETQEFKNYVDYLENVFVEIRVFDENPNSDSATGFLISTDSFRPCFGQTAYELNRTLYHNGINPHPVLGDVIFTSSSKEQTFNGQSRYYTINIAGEPAFVYVNEWGLVTEYQYGCL